MYIIIPGIMSQIRNVDNIYTFILSGCNLFYENTSNFYLFQVFVGRKNRWLMCAVGSPLMLLFKQLSKVSIDYGTSKT